MIRITKITILVLILYSCSANVEDVSNKLEKMAVSSKKSDTINFTFSDLIDSNYDNVLVLPSYTIIDRVEKKLGINLEDVTILCIK